MTDFSPRIHEFAVSKAREDGLKNVKIRECHGENIAHLGCGSFDALI